MVAAGSACGPGARARPAGPVMLLQCFYNLMGAAQMP